MATKRTLPASVAAGLLAGIAATATYYEAATDTETTVTPSPLPPEAVELPEPAGAPVIAAIEAAGPGSYSCARPAHDPATPSHAGELFCVNGAGGGFYRDAVEEAVAGEPLEGRRLEVRDGKVWVVP